MIRNFRSLFAMALLLGLVTAAASSCSYGTGGDTAAKATQESEQAGEKLPVKAVAVTGVSVEIAGMKPVAQNQRLALYFNEQTTEIAVVDKSSQSTWYSNPLGKGDDMIATAVNKDKLHSQFSLTYYNSSGQVFNYNNYNDSIKRNQFEAEAIEDGVKVTYVLGENARDMHSMPKKISQERFESIILKGLDDTKKKFILQKFSFLPEENAYERKDNTFNGLNLKRSLDIFDEAGYTDEDLAKDLAEFGIQQPMNDKKAFFTVSIEYRLDGDNLVATVPTAEIKYPKAFPIHKISVLEFFGAADQTKEGYMFVPDGSGSLIYLNNGKTELESYALSMYGDDGAIGQIEGRQFPQVSRLPVFGIKQDDEAFIGMIEQGDAVATIEAQISGKLTSYNNVFSTYQTVSKDELPMSGGTGNTRVPIFQDQILGHDISIRYAFLSGEEATYAGMAKNYRDYLFGKSDRETLAEEAQLPFYLELIGNVPKRETFLGVPYRAMTPLTTFEEAGEIADELKQAGIDNIKLRYVGWFNKGIEHRYPTRVKPDGDLGGSKGFRKLAERLSTDQISLFPDVALLNVYKSGSGFKPAKDASKFISRRTAKVFPFHPATQQKDATKNPYYILSPKRLPDLITQFLQQYDKYGVSGLSLRDLGDRVHSDFNTNAMIDRQGAKLIISDELARLSERTSEMLVFGGNAHAIPYADHIVGAPLTSSKVKVTDESVPFYQMVLHGYVDYAGQPLNLADDQNQRKNMLKMIETGANVYYTWTYADSSATKGTYFHQYYSTHYKTWLDEAKVIYDEVNSVLGPLRTRTITGHEKIADDVFRTDYEGGVSITVNYNKHDVRVNGTTVGAESYVVGGEHR